MIDVTDVAFVDAHPERDGCHHDGAGAAHEPILRSGAFFIRETRVISARGQPGFGQLRGDGLRGFLQGDVDNGRARRLRGEPAAQPREGVGHNTGCDAQGEVWPVKAGVRHVPGIEPETLGDVSRDGRGGGGGERQHAFDFERLRQPGELEVVGAKIVAPLRDAMRLIDHQERDLERTQRREKALVGEPLRRRVKQFQLARLESRVHSAQFIEREAGIDPRRRHVALPKEGDLVAHERDERRHHERQAEQVQGGQLVAKALARSGRENGERRAAVEKGADDLFLPGAERVEPECLAQGFCGIGRSFVWSLHGGGGR